MALACMVKSVLCNVDLYNENVNKEVNLEEIKRQKVLRHKQAHKDLERLK